jgi:hypothetical protein
MSNWGDKRWYQNFWGCCTMILFIVPILYFSVGMVQYHKIRTYAQTNCLVKNVSMKTCGRRVHRYSFGSQKCFLPIWSVKYIDYGIDKTITITGPEVVIHRDDIRNQFRMFKKYKVFMLQCKEYSPYIKSLLLFPNRLARLIHAIILFLIL